MKLPAQPAQTTKLPRNHENSTWSTGRLTI